MGLDIAKLKTDIEGMDPDTLLERMADTVWGCLISTIDGVKIDLEEGWVHMRKSNTEPIIRVYAEASFGRGCQSTRSAFHGELLA